MWLLDKRTLVISSAFCFRLRHGLRSLPWRDVESHHSQHALCTLDHVGFCQRSVARDVGRRFIFLSVLSGMDYKCPCVLVLIYIDARLSLRTTLTALQQSQLKVCSYFSHIFSVKSDLSEIGSFGSSWEIRIFPLWLKSFGFLRYEDRWADIFVSKECANVLLPNLIIRQLWSSVN